MLILFLAAATGSTLPARSQETIVIDLGDEISVDTEDMDKDGMAEYLIILVDVTVYEPGSYGVHGDIGQGITTSSGPFDLEIGPHPIELTFSGGQISRAAATGDLQVDLEAFSRDPEKPSSTRSYSTGISIEPTDFEPPSDSSSTEVSIIGTEVVLSGPIMEVRMNKSSPTLSFSYSGKAGSDTRASIKYLELIAYDDLNDDMKWDEGEDEAKYTADLQNVVWELGTDFSSGYDITLYGVIQLRLAGTSTFAAWAKMTFRISSEYLNVKEPSQKFDIDIDLWQPLDAERLALKQVLSDDTGRFELVEGDPVGADDHSITVMKDDDRAYGTYSWTDDIVTGRTELTDDEDAHSWSQIRGTEASIWFSYPLGEDIQLIHHDPTMRMDPDIPDIDEEDDFLVNRPILMIGGLILGLIIITGTIFLRNRSRGGSRHSFDKGGD